MNSVIVEVPCRWSGGRRGGRAATWGLRWSAVVVAIASASQLAAQPVATSEPPAPDLAAQAAALNGRVAAEVARGRRLRERTGVKDMIKLACVNDGMITLLQQARVSEAAFVAFKLAAAKADQAATQARFMDLTRGVDWVEAAGWNLRACVGGNQVQVHRELFGNDPTDDCNTLGQWGCISQALEHVSFASPFAPR